MTGAQPSKPALFVKAGGVLSLSGPGLLDLLQAVLARGVPFRFRAKGFSMSPFIREGDVITVSPLAGRPLGLGEVIAFISPETMRLVVHRVVGRQGDGWILAGDNVRRADGLVELDNLVGRVTSVQRNGRPVRFGLGPERVPIALLSRWGWLTTIVTTMWRLPRPPLPPRRRGQ